MLLWEGRVFKLDEHLERFLSSARMVEIGIPLPREELRGVVIETCRRNRFRHALIRINVSRGVGPASHNPGVIETGPTLSVFLNGLNEDYLSSMGRGLRAIISGVRRTPSISLEGRIKSCNYLNNILARLEAIRLGADAAIMLDVNNKVSEATDANVFAVRGGSLVTPPPINVLDGITRRTVMELSSRMGYSVMEREMTPYDLLTADEVFLTSTAGGVMPVVEINGRVIGEGHPGPVAGSIKRAYEELIIEQGEPVV